VSNAVIRTKYKPEGVGVDRLAVRHPEDVDELELLAVACRRQIVELAEVRASEGRA
jgi:hypothetical protein